MILTASGPFAAAGAAGISTNAVASANAPVDLAHPDFAVQFTVTTPSPSSGREHYTARSHRVPLAASNVFTRFNAILGTLLVVILTVGPLQDALFGIVLVTNAAIGIYQELRAKRTLDRLSLLTAPVITVARDGQRREVAVEDVVEDEVVELTQGSQVVADGTVVAADSLEVDESLLSGESVPLDKAVGAHVLSGSYATAGQGWYRADEVGPASYANRIAAEARKFSLVRSELRNGIDRILVIVTWLILPTAWSGWLRPQLDLPPPGGPPPDPQRHEDTSSGSGAWTR